MSERRSDPESYLSEIDRRLEAIQGELQPGRARPNQPPRRRGRTGSLAASLGRGAPASEPSEPASERSPVGERGAVTLKAGPFVDTAALRAFTERLAEMPGVENVTVRGFEGADRAIVDVELGP